MNISIDPISIFLNIYDEAIKSNALELRQIIKSLFPDIHEELDVAARIIAYGFGPKYSDNICTIIPSKTGLKLGFYKGTELPDPKCLLQGTGKVHKYVLIKNETDIQSKELNALLKEAFKAYRIRSNN
jgi:hypothetical protein